MWFKSRLHARDPRCSCSGGSVALLGGNFSPTGQKLVVFPLPPPSVFGRTPWSDSRTPAAWTSGAGLRFCSLCRFGLHYSLDVGAPPSWTEKYKGNISPSLARSLYAT